MTFGDIFIEFSEKNGYYVKQRKIKTLNFFCDLILSSKYQEQNSSLGGFKTIFFLSKAD